ncbi:MAG: hypothetical protein JW963_02215 [Anaerolineales bacterium]|nr:hypothetical protein [Anaerolineales bacterium]
MDTKTLIGNLKENKEQLLWYALIACVALLLLRSCFSGPKDALPTEVHQLIDRQYVNCVDVKGSSFEGGNQLEGECSSVATEVVGEGTIPPQEQALGVTRAICYRIQYENPYFWAQSQTQFEEIDFAKRTASKVTVLQNGGWVIFPDQEIQDRERWEAYACPGEYDITE